MTRIGIDAVGDSYVVESDGLRVSFQGDVPLRCMARDAVERRNRELRESAIWKDGLKAGAVFASVAWFFVLVLIWAVTR